MRTTATKPPMAIPAIAPPLREEPEPPPPTGGGVDEEVGDSGDVMSEVEVRRGAEVAEAAEMEVATAEAGLDVEVGMTGGEVGREVIAG